MRARPPKKPFIAIKPTVAQTTKPLLTINLSDLQKIDEFCDTHDAQLDPTYTGTGCNGCISIGILLPDDKTPGVFFQSLMTHITPLVHEDLSNFMCRNASVLRGTTERWLIFPRLTAVFN
jgi:hypothetical protein